MRHEVFNVVGVVCFLTSFPLLAEEQRYTERIPTATVRMEQQTVTTYSQRPTTQSHEFNRVVYDPVVSYQCQRRVVGWLNPFTGPYETYQVQPVVTWQPRVEKVAYSTTRYNTVPETRVVERPVRYLGFVDRQRTVNVEPAREFVPVVARERSSFQHTIAADSGVASQPITARPTNNYAPRYGGVGRLDGDYPRHAMGPTSTMR
ncbi:MAG: hypothetical protein ACI9HK_003130 [Pirellulaceae bacterium]|jgi:hypothetical protein